VAAAGGVVNQPQHSELVRLVEGRILTEQHLRARTNLLIDEL